MDRILQEHPIAAWTLDEDFSATGPFENIDSFFTITTSIVIPTQTPTIVSSIATITTSTAHGFAVGDTVEIINVVPTGYRRRYRITEDEYDYYIGRLAKIDFSAIYDGVENLEATGEAYCTTDYCEIKIPDKRAK